MRISRKVQKILSFYEADTPGTKANLARILMNGKVGGTGKLLVLAVDQGFEHGPDRSFSANPEGYDPHYMYKLAINAGMSAYAGPLGWLEAGAGTYCGQVPLILKMNSSNSLMGKDTAPGSDASLDQFEELRDLSAEAKAAGLAVVVWSYPRGNFSKEGERAVDIISYGAHMAALLGAHIIKVKLPTEHLEHPENKKAFEANKIPIKTLEDRIRVVVKGCFNGRRIVIFSGLEMKNANAVVDDAKAIAAGGAFGSIIGRNCFQRPYDEALTMLKDVAAVYQKA